MRVRRRGPGLDPPLSVALLRRSRDRTAGDRAARGLKARGGRAEDHPVSAPTSPAPRAATALRRVAALLRRHPAARPRPRAAGTPPRGGGPAVVTAPDRAALHLLLATHLLEHPGRPLALLLVDLLPADGRDGAGDDSEDLLRAVTGRAADAVRDRDVLVRLPGGRLAVLVVGGTASSARRVGERVRAALQAGVVVGGALVDVDASVGSGAAGAGSPGGAPTAPAGPRDRKSVV